MVKLSKFKEYFKESKAHWHMMKLEQDIKNLEKRLKLEEDLEKRLGYFYNHSLKKKVLISRINELKSRVDCLDENMDSPTVYTVKIRASMSRSSLSTKSNSEAMGDNNRLKFDEVVTVFEYYL
jgi:ABC-type Na+ transport system ATPase subunit NatA